MLELNYMDLMTPGAKDNAHLYRSVISCAMPVILGSTDVFSQSRNASPPFASSFSLPTFLPPDQLESSPDNYLAKSCSLGLRDSIISAARNEGGINNVIISAVGSISMKQNRSKALAMSHEQKSKRILQHCSSWTQLDDTKANRGLVHGQGKILL